jgi:hypothetical protein
MKFFAATEGSVLRSACSVIRCPPIFTFISNCSTSSGGLLDLLFDLLLGGARVGEDVSVLPVVFPLAGLFGWNVYSSYSFMKSTSSLVRSFLFVLVFLTESACKNSHLFSKRLSCSLCLAVKGPSGFLLSLFGWNGVDFYISSSCYANLCYCLFKYSVYWRASLYSTRRGENPDGPLILLLLASKSWLDLRNACGWYLYYSP